MSNDHRADFNSLLPAAPFTRRDFVVSLLASGFALAVQPVMAQTAISTDRQGLNAGPISIKVADGELAAYRAEPATGKNFPVVLVVSEIFGVHEYIADLCRRLAQLGYQAIAPELFTRYGDVKKLSSIDEIIKIVSQVPDAQVMSDLDACVAWSKAHGGDTARLGITGFCWGGRLVWLYAAHNRAVKAGAAWYGRLSGDTNERTPQQPLTIATTLKTPVLGLYGGQDQGIPQIDVEKMRAALKQAGNPSEIHVYPDASHAFHADYRPSYNKAAAEDGWQRMLVWFKKYGV